MGDAIKTAETRLGNNSCVVAANLGQENGYLTYTVCAVDEEMKLHKVIVGASNGKNLLTTVLPIQKFILHHMMQ